MEIKRTFDILPYALKNHPFEDCLAAKENGEWRKYSTQEFSDKVNQLSNALIEIFDFTTTLNKFVDESEPWKTIKSNPEKTEKDLTVLVESFRLLGIILRPFIPNSSRKILNMLNIEENDRDFKFFDSRYKINKGHKINDPEPLFPKYENKDS